MLELDFAVNEFFYWLCFIAFNSILYAVNYIYYFQGSTFLPYIHQFKLSRKLGLTASVNQDLFRYSVEFSILILVSRIINLSFLAEFITICYVLILIFNLYQYTMRRVYECQPNFFSDLKLLKNGFVIVWHESKWKMIGGFFFVGLVLIGLHLAVKTYLIFSFSILPNTFFYGASIFWISTLAWAVLKQGFYINYPNDILSKYHWDS